MRLVQMIENSEECVLRFFRFCKKLNVVDYQDVNQLVKMDKIIYRIITTMIHELVDELLRTYIQNNLIGIGPFYFVSNGLGQVCFSKSYSTINNQRVE